MNCHAGVNKYAVGKISREHPHKIPPGGPFEFHALHMCTHTHTSLRLGTCLYTHRWSLHLRAHTHPPIGAVGSDVDLKGALSVESY